MSTSTRLRELTATELDEERAKGVLILDTRPADQFASFHIRGSIQISLPGHFAAWAALLIRPEAKLVLIAEDERHAGEGYDRLFRVGLGRVIGFLLPMKINGASMALTSPEYQCSDARQFLAPRRRIRARSSSMFAAAPSG